jgi:xanthine dehydrogenase YagT iron-sulfur-binding subunit
MADDTRPGQGPSRRGILTGATGAAALPLVAAAKPAAHRPAAGARPHMDMTLSVNGRDHRVALDPRTTLLDALREHLDLTGSKKGCDHGQCGACTVHIDGRRVLACLTLAATVQGRKVTTIEGLAPEGALHPMQAAFIEHDAFQCGYCTPGQIMSAVACVHEGHAKTDTTIREYMSGNLCRCAAYPKIVAAVRDAAGKMERA